MHQKYLLTLAINMIFIIFKVKISFLLYLINKT